MNTNEMNEISRHHKAIEEIERTPLAERKESAKEFAADLAANPELVAQRVGWLIDGNYGQGSCTAAWQIITAPRLNRIAALSILIAALEWRCPSAMARKVWKGLTADQQAKIDGLIKKEIEDAEERVKLEGCPVKL